MKAALFVIPAPIFGAGYSARSEAQGAAASQAESASTLAQSSNVRPGERRGLVVHVEYELLTADEDEAQVCGPIAHVVLVTPSAPMVD